MDKEEEFYRIKRLPPYVFAEVNRLKAQYRAAGKDIIDFGMGNPDFPTPDHIVEKMREVALDGKTHRYSMSKGIPALRRAQANYYERRFNVSLDYESEIIVTIGSKEGLAHLAQAITKPGDVIIVPDPSYPIHTFGFIIAEATVWTLPKTPEKKLIEQLREAVEQATPKPLAIVLNYPCNPTAEIATLDFYEEIVDFCHFHDIYILSDLAYCEIYFDDYIPPSILEIPKARDIAVEFTTMSKTYSMAGWRIGFAVGCKKLIHALTRIKSYLDYGAFAPLQIASITALNGDQSCVEEARMRYQNRRDVLVDGLERAGWPVPKPKASMFTWAPLPEKLKHLGSLEFSKMLMSEADVAVAPGIGFGKYGDDYVRIALVENEMRIRQATRNIAKFIDKY